MQNERLAAALGYAARGWKVVPLHSVEATKDEGGKTKDAGPSDPSSPRCSCGKACGHPGKHPRWHATELAHGVKDATTVEGRIRRWWGM